MNLTKTLQITVTGKTKKECEEVFTMIRSICDVEVEEVDLPTKEEIQDIVEKVDNATRFTYTSPNYWEIAEAISKRIRGEI